MTSYPTPAFRRTALPPGLLGAIVLIGGAALVGTDGFIWIDYAVSILALIVAVYAVQAKQWWWLIGLVPIVVAWNPVFVIPWSGPGWLAAQFFAAFVFIAAGILVKVSNPEDRNSSRR